ncbi:hypothetical protein C5E08_15505 [Rathayibacter iranicus]|uniref:Peptidase inhibitor family I36 n=2 Tax=Rathayibacter iranicus TaxID=59737 RepID=A0AAD1END9_9MICO|nr:hypothetical protein C7V51_15755 [Rathayibacter iranicus]PPI41404.1 hypothetical protein C5E09_14615 [Rathayibacter iranicus]PPI57432.1 hypothetical protein C5E08_15505 [Rathayibacter iranicus]
MREGCHREMLTQKVQVGAAFRDLWTPIRGSDVLRQIARALLGLWFAQLRSQELSKGNTMSHIARSTFPRRLILAAGSAAIATVSVLACGVAPASADQRQFCPEGQYCAWENDQRQGNIFNNVVTMSYVGDSWNDQFSSLENRKRDSVVFYEELGSGGDERVVRHDEVAQQLQFEWTDHASTWNDCISSITAY